MDKPSFIDREELVKQYYFEGDTLSEIGRKLGVDRKTIRRDLRRLGLYKKPLVKGKIHESKPKNIPKPDKVKRFIFTSAQNNTYVHKEFFNNLIALADYYGDTEIVVGTFTYDISKYLRFTSEKNNTSRDTDKEMWYDPILKDYVNDSSIKLSKDLIWCGEMNISPTATNPLSGLQNYTGISSGIFPHTKIVLESIPNAKNENTKINYTTGCCTLRNYIQKKSGQKADFHHSYGALIVEIDPDGDWFARQINAENSGKFYDLDICVDNSKITTNNNVEAIVWGDIHGAKFNYDLFPSIENMIELLKPKYQFFHDILDFESRSHHHIKDFFKNFEKYVTQTDSVEDEIIQTSKLLNEFYHISKEHYNNFKMIVVDSNHDRAFKRWLNESNFRTDLKNSVFFLEALVKVLKEIQSGNVDFHLLEYFIKLYDCPDVVQFLHQDESFVICKDRNGGIECGCHGDLGSNGSRGSVTTFTKVGKKFNVGHSHTASIKEGVFSTGMFGKLDCGYNKGLSSWSHSTIITYKNGKRSIVTIKNHKWKGELDNE